MKICIVSDTHGFTPSLPKCDIVIHGGDFSPLFDHSRQFQYSWSQTNFKEWIKSLDCKHFVYVSGNHDKFLNSNYNNSFKSFSGMTADNSKFIYLENDIIILKGFKIYGSPYQLPYGYGWAFNRTEEQLAKIYADVKSADIVISHGPAYGLLDPGPRYDKQGKFTHWEKAGSKELLKLVDRINPKLLCVGHLHSGAGQIKYKDTLVVNGALVNEQYKLVNEPIVVEI